MTAYLSEAWLADPCDPAAEALAAAGGSLRLRRVVGGAPDGEARLDVTVADGEVTYDHLDDEDLDVTLTDTYANALAIVRGELDPNAAFMRGQTKVAGDTGPLLDLLAATRSERYEQLRAEVAAAIDD